MLDMIFGFKNILNVVRLVIYRRV